MDPFGDGVDFEVDAHDVLDVLERDLDTHLTGGIIRFQVVDQVERFLRGDQCWSAAGDQLAQQPMQSTHRLGA